MAEQGDQRGEDLRAERIESRVNEERAKSISVSLGGGLDIADMAQVFEYAKGMSLSGPMVPAFCRNRPWVCFGICVQAIEWGISAFSLARGAYEVKDNRSGETTVAYTSQVLHAVLEKRAPIKERLDVRYEGEGDDLVCIVTGAFKGEEKAREWRSPKLGERRPEKIKKRSRYNDGEEYEVIPGSPLWYSKPMVQLFYDTSRDWGRVFCPDVIMGVYDRDEMQEHGFEPTAGSTGTPPDDGGLGERLSARAISQMGFAPAHVVANAVDEAKAKADMSQTASHQVASPSPDAVSGEVETPSPSPRLSPDSDAPPPEAATTGGGATDESIPMESSGPPVDSGSPAASRPADASTRPSHRVRRGREEGARLV
jgi:hypothetical protein